MATPHNAAGSGDIAPVVLLPGDPLRAEYIARSFLDSPRQVTAVRNMLGFTGTWQGRPVTVMGSGMGGPSCGIYAWELFAVYGVQRIIRTGTAGGLQAALVPGDIVCAMSASTDSGYASQYNLPGTYAPAADYRLLELAMNAARSQGVRALAGTVFSSDYFSQYNARGPQASWQCWARSGALVQDMETYALYCTAAWLGKRALSILTHTDSCVSGHGLSAESRLSALDPMIRIALEIAHVE